MSDLDMTSITNADGTTTYTFAMTTDKPLKRSEVRERLLASAGFTDMELFLQLSHQLWGNGAVVMYDWASVMEASETSSLEEAKDWFGEHYGSWSRLEDCLYDAGSDYFGYCL